MKISPDHNNSGFFTVSEECPDCGALRRFSTRFPGSAERRMKSVADVHWFHCPGKPKVPKFTGFDGIPDWTRELELEKELANIRADAALLQLKSHLTVREQAERIDNLEHQLASMKSAYENNKIANDAEQAELKRNLEAEKAKTTNWYESWKAKSDRYDEVVRRVHFFQDEVKRIRRHYLTVWLSDVDNVLKEILE